MKPHGKLKDDKINKNMVYNIKWPQEVIAALRISIDHTDDLHSLHVHIWHKKRDEVAIGLSHTVLCTYKNTYIYTILEHCGLEDKNSSYITTFALNIQPKRTVICILADYIHDVFKQSSEQ